MLEGFANVVKLMFLILSLKRCNKHCIKMKFSVKFGLLPSKKVGFICFNESPLKIIIKFYLESSFCPDFVVMQEKGLIRKLNLKR